MANLLQAQQYIDEGNHEAAKEVLESALRDEPRNRDALKLLHSLERSTTQIVAVKEASLLAPVLSLEDSINEDLPAPILESASQIIKAMNDAAIGGLIITVIIAIGGVGFLLWKLIEWAITIDLSALNDVLNGLPPSLGIMFGMAIGLALITFMLDAIKKLKC